MGVQIVRCRLLSGHRQTVALFCGQARPDVTVPTVEKQTRSVYTRGYGKMKNLFPRHHILLYLQAVWTFPDAFALVHVRSARKTMSGRVRFVTTAGTEWMATVQLAVLATTDFVGPAQVFRAANISASVALCWFVVADYVNIVADSVGDLAPIDCRRVTQFYAKINTRYYFKNTYSITNLCI